MSSSRILLAASTIAVAAPASALQPLDQFLRGARSSSTENAEARAIRARSRAEADAALGRALPRISLRGEYTRNQFETVISLPGAGGGPATPVTITPHDQLDGAATLDVPLVDLARFAEVAAARTSARASTTEEAAVDLRVQSLATQDYYQLVADLALVESSRRALDVSRTSLQLAEQRHAAGAVAVLDVDRARAEVERRVQQLVSAELQVSLVARALRSLTGLAPELEGEVSLEDDLHEEPPLERFQAPEGDIPTLAAAIRRREASEQQARAQRFTLVPSLGASLREQATTVEGLAGQDLQWQAVVGLSWSFDLTTLADIRAREAEVDAARARERRARLDARDDIHRAWQTVRANIARSRSARAEATVSARAAALALDRYRVGAEAQLDLLQAQRDAFSADATRIQADSDLLNARAQLRVAAGESLLEPARGAP